LPLLAHRQTITLPMIFSLERMRDPDSVSKLLVLHQLQGDLNSTEALSLLRESQITHIFIGEHGGPIDASSINSSKYFTVLFQHGDVQVLALNY